MTRWVPEGWGKLVKNAACAFSKPYSQKVEEGRFDLKRESGQNTTILTTNTSVVGCFLVSETLQHEDLVVVLENQCKP